MTNEFVEALRKLACFAEIFSNVNVLQNVVHEVAKSKGWLSGPKSLAQDCADIHAEVSELWETEVNERRKEQCDKGIYLTCEEEEFADIIIRTLVAAKQHGIDIGHAVFVKTAYNQVR